MIGTVPSTANSDPMVEPDRDARRFQEAVGVPLLAARLLGHGLHDAHQVPDRDALVEQTTEHALDVAQGHIGRRHLLQHDRI